MTKWAVITGATSGIGLELAKCFASDGWNLVLNARREKALQETGDALRREHAIEYRAVAVDLSSPQASETIFQATRGLNIEALVNNAGFGKHGPFSDVPLQEHEGMVEVNIMALMKLTHLFLPQMRQRKSGIVLNVGSVAAFQPGPTMSVYYASKAFVYSFSYALAAELNGSGVTVTVLNPGTTRTAFFDRAGVHMSRPFPLTHPAKVARAGYRAALKGKRSVTPGLVNRMMSWVSPALPSRFTSAIVARVHSGEKNDP